MARAMALEWTGGGFAGLLRRVARDIRVMVPICIILICGSFAAATLLSMRLDRAHALAQAAAFERIHMQQVAQGAAATLDRFARLGRLYADNPLLGGDVATAEPAIRDIAVFDADGELRAHLHAGRTLPALPHGFGARALFGGGLTLRDNARVIAVLFDPAKLAPAVLVATPQPGAIAAPLPDWPLFAATQVDEASALKSWTGALPLYLFVILGPALAGGWLAALFVGSFERHARAARAVRSLRATRPVEAKLMVRLANAERGAVEALRAKSEFIAHMSHELRTPLNAVIGFSDVIAQDIFGKTDHPKYREYARDIAGAGRELHAKIGDILEFANIEAGRYPLALERVDLAALTQACIDEQMGRAFSRRITLSLDFAEPGAVRADALAVRRVLINLLANALAYTREGGAVRLDVRFEEGAGLITLRDTGMGFSDREAAKAGRAFQRFDRPGTVTGAGLGLAIAMELVRRMGGAMRLSGQSGEGVPAGSVMELRLPKP